MKQAKSESPSDIVRWLQSEAASLWPAILGSLSLRRSPCVRESCPACLSGEQHQSYVLYNRLNGRRFSVYVPEELVPELRRCVDNARPARATAGSRSALCQGIEARAGEHVEEQEELRSVESGGATDKRIAIGADKLIIKFTPVVGAVRS